MPQIRQYTEATTIEQTDAFVIDRIGEGTLWATLETIRTRGVMMIYASLPAGTTDAWNPVGWVSGVNAIVITAAGSTLAGLSGGSLSRRVTLLNDSSGALTLSHNASGTAGDSFLLPGAASLSIAKNGGVGLIYDATASAWRAVFPATGPYIAAFEFLGGTPPLTGEIMGGHVFTAAVATTINFADVPIGSSVAEPVGHCETNPASTFTATIYQVAGGVSTSIGTMAISTLGVFSFAVAAAHSFAVGDSLKFVAPVSTDAALANLWWSIPGTLA